MNFIQSVKTCFQKYANFKGRATRSEFWWFQLFFWLVLFGVIFVLWLSGYDITDEFLDVILIGEIFLFIPVLSVTSRRLHDLGLTGWVQAPVVLTYLENLDIFIDGFSEISLVQNINNVAFFFFALILVICAFPGRVGKNKYGSDPKAPNLDEVFN